MKIPTLSVGLVLAIGALGAVAGSRLHVED